MLKMMFLIVTITSQSDGLNATIKHGPLPAERCISEMADYDASRILGPLPDDSTVTSICVPTDEARK